HAHHLLQGMQDLGQVALVGHHFIDVLVRPGNLIDHAFVLAADDALGLPDKVGLGEALGRGRAAHAPAGTVGAGTEALRVALAAHDVATRAHAAGNDAELALPRTDRALARHP